MENWEELNKGAVFKEQQDSMNGNPAPSTGESHHHKVSWKGKRREPFRAVATEHDHQRRLWSSVEECSMVTANWLRSGGLEAEQTRKFCATSVMKEYSTAICKRERVKKAKDGVRQKCDFRRGLGSV